MITTQVLNDLKTANEKVVHTEGRIISALDILLALSTVNLNSYNVVREYAEYNSKTFNARKWIELCEKAGI